MSGIEAWSTTAASNNMAVPNGWPEGQSPSSVNDCARNNMAAIRTWYENAQWINYGFTHTYASSTSFTIAGSDKTAIYPVGRRIKAVGSSTGTIYGTITTSAFSTDTTITIAWDSGSLSNETLTIYAGILTPSNSALPSFSGVLNVAGTSSAAGGIALFEDTDNGTHKATLSAPASLAADIALTLPSASGTIASTGNKLSDFAATSSAELRGIISDESGTGSLLFGTGPQIIKPDIVGVTDGSSAAAGSVGEVISSSVAAGSATSLTTITAKTITSITLSEGEWDIDAVAHYNGGATTTVQMTCASISTATNTFTSSEDRSISEFYNGAAVFNATNNPATFIGSTLPTLRVNISTPTTYYLVGFAKFATSTMAAFGIIRATRIR